MTTPDERAAKATRESVAAILRSAPARCVNFTVEGISVNPVQMEKVAREIIQSSVVIRLGSSGSFDASYTSWKTRRPKAGEARKTGRITIRQKALTSAVGKAAIFHESVHALMDVAGYKPGMSKDEAVAYLADALFMNAQGASLTLTGPGKAIFQAASSLIASHNLLRKPGTILKWADFADLLSAIKASPLYR